MTCIELVELVTDYLEDAMPMEDRRIVDEHLAECEDCVRHVDQMLRTIEITAQLADEGDVAPPVAIEDLLAAFRSSAQQND